MCSEDLSTYATNMYRPFSTPETRQMGNKLLWVSLITILLSTGVLTTDGTGDLFGLRVSSKRVDAIIYLAGICTVYLFAIYWINVTADLDKWKLENQPFKDIRDRISASLHESIKEKVKNSGEAIAKAESERKVALEELRRKHNLSDRNEQMEELEPGASFEDRLEKNFEDLREKNEKLSAFGKDADVLNAEYASKIERLEEESKKNPEATSYIRMQERILKYYRWRYRIELIFHLSMGIIAIEFTLSYLIWSFLT